MDKRRMDLIAKLDSIAHEYADMPGASACLYALCAMLCSHEEDKLADACEPIMYAALVDMIAPNN